MESGEGVVLIDYSWAVCLGYTEGIIGVESDVNVGGVRVGGDQG